MVENKQQNHEEQPEKKSESKKNKSGVSVHEIENFGKKYSFEITFLVYFIVATFFTFLFWGSAWSVYLAGLGGIIGIWLPEKIAGFTKASFRFIFKQEKVTQIILAVVGVIIAIFLAPIIFLLLGLVGGMGLFNQGYKAAR